MIIRVAAHAARLGALIAIPVATVRLVVPTRPDWAGHLAAGFGATLALMALLAWRRTEMRWSPVVVACVALLVGIALEVAFFNDSVPDPIDVAQQSLGALVAAAAVVGRRGSRAMAAAAASLALPLVAVGWKLAF